MKFYRLLFSLFTACYANITFAHTDVTPANTLAPVLQRDDKLASRQKQREIYQKIHQLLSRSQSQATQQIVQALLEHMTDYPLYPYAQYQLLSVKQALQFDEITHYQTQYPDLLFAKQLKQQWLAQQKKQAHWQNILQQRDKLDKDTSTQCILLEAEANLLPKRTALSAQWLQHMQDIWLTGKSLPQTCENAVTIWRSTFPLSHDLVKSRALLALEENNPTLLKQLEKQVNDLEIKNWLSTLHRLMQNPVDLANKEHPFYPTNTENKDIKKRVYLALFPAFIKTRQEANIDTPIDPFAPYAQWALDLSLSAEQQQDWQKHVINQFFDSENHAIQQWRDHRIMTIKDDRLVERRLRLAIRKKESLQIWLPLLSIQAQNKDEWIYWRAKVLQGIEHNEERANKMLDQLAKQRGFYALLASMERNIDYQPKMQHLDQTHSPSIDRLFATQLARITELRHFNALTDINKEWRQLLSVANFEQKLALADYAQKQGWFNLSVEATIQAKAWHYIALRLPNAYLDWFDLHLKNKSITRTFAMAIARQESAWKPHVSSHANARGLMQLLPKTAKQTAQHTHLPYTHEKQLFDPFDNIMLGTAHLQTLYDKYGNNRILIAAAYNAGASRVDHWLKRSSGQLNMAEFVASIPFYETRDYVKNVLTYDLYYQILQHQPQQKFSQEEYNRLY